MTGIKDMTEGERRWYIGVRRHAIEALIWDHLDPDEYFRNHKGEDYTSDNLLTETSSDDDVLVLLDQAYDQGYRMAQYDADH